MEQRDIPAIRLEPFDQGDYEAWRERSIRAYAAEHIADGKWRAEEAEERAAEEFATLLGDGLATADNFLRAIVDHATGRKVGMLWFAIEERGQGRGAYLYDFAVDELERGRGFGRAALVALEAEVAGLGLSFIRLHVFGTNEVARRLYESEGYVITNVVMVKNLS